MAGGRRPRVIAFYLPQFHPIPENDLWWGEGFTEWTNVRKAKPLYTGHYQPHEPADLGYYDLREPQARQAQADLARKYGIEGFCYWHYWFGAGRQLLERPFSEVLASGKPDFPFCVAWANQSWTGIWHGAPNRLLIEQTYPGAEDHERHFYAMLPAFQDPRYIRVDGKPLFVVYAPTDMPNPVEYVAQWRTLAQREGLGGLYFVAHGHDVPEAHFDAFIQNLPFVSMPVRGLAKVRRAVNFVLRRTVGRTLADLGLDRGPHVRQYADFVAYFKASTLKPRELPLLVPNWDNTPRSGGRGVVLHGAEPALFEELCSAAISKLAHTAQPLVFLKAWNEWAEGNHVEPDRKYGLQYLEAMQRGLGLQRAGEGGE